jgi:hypothetical protein
VAEVDPCSTLRRLVGEVWQLLVARLAEVCRELRGDAELEDGPVGDRGRPGSTGD